MTRFRILPNPRCTFEEFRISSRYSPALKARDWKDPVLVIEVYEDDIVWLKHFAKSRGDL